MTWQVRGYFLEIHRQKAFSEPERLFLACEMVVLAYMFTRLPIPPFLFPPRRKQYGKHRANYCSKRLSIGRWKY